jgi:uncharacterized repeat protein (TIGR01451 family)
MRLALVTAAILSASIAPVAAGVTARQAVEKEVVVIDENGEPKTVRKPADTVKPGQTVIYTLKFVNDDAVAAEGMTLVMPVPREVVYVEGSVGGAPATITFSADGGETYVARGRLTVTQDGAVRPATNGDITHIKWTLAGSVAPKGTGEIFFRGVLK